MRSTPNEASLRNLDESSQSTESLNHPREPHPSVGVLGRTPGAGKGSSASAGPLRILMLATVFNLSYRVLRCAHASGAEVFVLGNLGARGLRFSRHCRRFVLSDCVINGERDEALALEINCIARDFRITLVMPGDAPSTRAVIACRDLIEAECFPLPSLDRFDCLNNKWMFARICENLGIRYPATRLLPDAATLAREITTGGLEYPLVAKPLSRSGNGGVLILDGVDSENRLNTINYKPVLVQTLIPGDDIGASVYARAGKIEAYVAHWLRRKVYHTFHDERIYSDISKIIETLGVDGVYNFDMILSPDGSIWHLECNPRFYFKITLSMIAGINFVELGLPGATSNESKTIPDGVEVRFPEAVLASFLSDFCTRRDFAMAAYICSDPLPYLMENLNLTV